MSNQNYDLSRFLTAQERIYETALNEIRGGRKRSHWIWYIFPQIRGLGHSRISEHYAIADLEEARAYLHNITLRSRLIEISGALLTQSGDLHSIMGSPDDLKVRSCMTLFHCADPTIAVFQQVLDRFCGGIPDQNTLDILAGAKRGIAPKPPRAQMAEVFADTRKHYTSDPTLIAAISETVRGTRFYAADELPALPENPHRSSTVTVTPYRSFEAAEKLTAPGKRVCVLNFASAISPGGGVLTGARAQEESLCRCSTLYPALTTEALLDTYYRYNRAHYDPLYTDACIFTPDVVVFKSDTNIPALRPENEWFRTDVVTCAAPNLKQTECSPDELYRIHVRRAEHILSAAIDNGTDRLVLGAFGCGAFRNDPAVVAKAYRDVLEKLGGYFECVQFAIFAASDETPNLIAFRDVFGQ